MTAGALGPSILSIDYEMSFPPSLLPSFPPSLPPSLSPSLPLSLPLSLPTSLPPSLPPFPPHSLSLTRRGKVLRGLGAHSASYQHDLRQRVSLHERDDSKRAERRGRRGVEELRKRKEEDLEDRKGRRRIEELRKKKEEDLESGKITLQPAATPARKSESRSPTMTPRHCVSCSPRT